MAPRSGFADCSEGVDVIVVNLRRTFGKKPAALPPRFWTAGRARARGLDSQIDWLSGGATVDAWTHRIKRTEPVLRLQRADALQEQLGERVHVHRRGDLAVRRGR